MPLTLRWAAAPAALGTVASAHQDPDGSVWVLAHSATGDGLWHFQGTAAVGHWAIPGRASLAVQTVGSGDVWLGAPSTEVAFAKVAHTFQSYAGAGTLAARTVAGYSVALDQPESVQGIPSAPPYVELAPLHGAAHRVKLPGATVPSTPLGAVTPGPSDTALVAVGSDVWAIPVAGGVASMWAHLPTGALPAPLAWGDSTLWCVIGPAGAPAGIDQLRAGQTGKPLPMTGAHPPLSGTAMVFAGGDLWWATAGHLYAYNPASGQVLRGALPPGTGTPVLTAVGSGVWVASGGKVAVALPPTGQS
jgi:hypothetical protein